MVVAALVLALQAASSGPPNGGPLEAMTRSVAAVEAGVEVALDRAWAARADDPVALFGRGLIAVHTYRYPTADRHFAAMASRTSDPVLGAWARFGLALSARTRGAMARADSLYRDAWTRARTGGDAPAEWEILLSWIAVRDRRPGPPRPEALLARIDSLGLAASDPVRRFRARCTAATVTGLFVPAIYHTADSALAAGERRLAARCLFVVASRISRQGYGDSAGVWLERVARWQREARDRSALATTLQWAGFNESTRGRYGLARPLLEAAIAEGRSSGNLQAVLWARHNLASVALALGARSVATVEARQADSLATALGDAAASGAIQSTLAQLAHQGGNRSAARAAALRYRRAAISKELLADAFRGLAEQAATDREWTTANAYLDTATVNAAAVRLDGTLISIREDRARLALRQGRPAEALRLYRDLDSLTGSVSFSAELRAARAVALLRTGDPDGAATLLTALTDSLDRWRDALTDEQLRRAVFDLRDPLARTSPLAQGIAELALTGRTELALQLAERRLARSLLDRLVVADVAGTGGGRIRPSSGGAGPAAADLVRALPARTAAVVFVAPGESPGAMLVATARGVRAVPLPVGDSLAALTGRIQALLEAGESAMGPSRVFGRQVIDPLLAVLPPDVTRLAVVLDGPLHAVPVAAWRTGAGQPVADRLMVTVTPSLTVLARLAARAPARGTAVLAYGDPVFPPIGRRDATAWFRFGGDESDLPRLPRSGAEARALGRLAPAVTLRLRQEASEAWLRTSDLAGFRLIHFGTHALVDRETVARTALALAPGGGHDGLLTVSELSALRLDADLVTLSSCRSSQGQQHGSEGVQGLATAALEAGARAVLAANWNVTDQLAAEFTGRFYREAAAGRPLDEAFAATMRALRVAGRPIREWAAFTLIGHGAGRLPLTRE